MAAGAEADGNGGSVRFRIPRGAGSRTEGRPGPRAGRSTSPSIRRCARFSTIVPAMSRRSPIGEVMRAGAIGQVVESRSEAFAAGDLVHGRLRLAGLRALRWRPADGGQGLRKLPVADIPGCARRHRSDGLLRAARSGQSQGWRHRGGLRRGRRDRIVSGPDCQNSWLPHHRHRRRSREVPLGDQRARRRRGNRLQERGRRRAAGCTSARTASTCISTTSAARSSKPRSAR